jgi:3-dehydro-4-phosphotetronate decarboxylase
VIDMTETAVIQNLIARAKSLFDRGYTSSAGGNLSHRSEDGFLVTATNTSFGWLEASDFVRCNLEARALRAGVPSKEAPFHASIFRRRSEVNAVVHLHSPASLALSALVRPTDDGNVLPVLSSYAVTKVGRVPMLEYIAPGAPRLFERIEELCGDVNAILLQNHGLIAFASSLELACDIAEEFEANARAWLATLGQARALSDAELLEAKALNGARIAAGTQRPRLLEGVRWFGGAS